MIVRACRRIADSPRFEAVTLAVIGLNALVLGLETYEGVEDQAGDLLGTLNAVFLGYFVVELTIKLIAHGVRFFRSPWNVFDFVVVGAAFLPGVRENATLLRIVRLLRVFRLITVMPELRVLIRGLLRSIAPLASVALLTLLLFYVYGMVGWLLFEEHDPENWNSLGKAMLTLFSVLTLEEWTEIQRTALEYTSWAWVYFVSFVLISSFLLLNMVIAVVINSVEEARSSIAAEERRAELEALAGEDDADARILKRIDSLRDTIEALEADLGRRDLPRV